MQLFFGFLQVRSRVLMIGVAPLLFTRADGAAIQKRLGPFERLFRHAQRVLRFAIFQLRGAEGGAIEQEQPVAFLHAIAKVRVDGNNMARDSRTEMGESVLVGQDLPRLGFEDRPDRTEGDAISLQTHESRTALREFDDTGLSG